MDQREGSIWLRIGVYEGSRHTPASYVNNAVIVVYHPHSSHLIMSNIRKGLVDFIMQVANHVSLRVITGQSQTSIGSL